MSEIHILPVEISNKIAAGEVVERPASVIKELVENSIDAGASRITVEIKNGGATYMCVTDNGKGMSADDALRAFYRHATSKIQTEEDLDAIFTLGFRGEALSSIGAVSKSQLYTKQEKSDCGICVTCEGGEIIASEESGMPTGTRFIVKDLFYNTPARMKFLKKDATEAGYISDVMIRFILSHPEISFRYIKNGKESLFSQGDGNLKNAIYSVYGLDYANAVIDVSYERGAVKINGMTGKGNLARPNRSFQSFFVNGRYIKSPLITRAVEEAYKNQIMIGKYPVCALNIEINPAYIDINVHPTKLEVKFSNDKEVYEAVYYAIKSAIYAIPDVPVIEKKEKKEKVIPPKIEQIEIEKNISDTPLTSFLKSSAENHVLSEKPMQDKREEKIGLPKESSASDIGAPKEEKAKITPQLEKKEITDDFAQIEKPKYDRKSSSSNSLEAFIKKETNENSTTLSEPQRKLEIKPKSDETEKESHSEKFIEPEVNVPQKTKKEIYSDIKITGQIFNTYIIGECGDEIIFVDQHAAHERIKYEQLLQSIQSHQLYPQILLEGIIVHLSGAEEAAFEANAELISSLGFEAESYGENTVIIRATPPDVEASLAEDLFVELLSEINNSKKEIITSKMQRLTYTIACKAAIKANHKLSEAEMKNLLVGVMELENINTCPHGRPIMIKMTKKELEKQFKRIV